MRARSILALLVLVLLAATMPRSRLAHLAASHVSSFDARPPRGAIAFEPPGDWLTLYRWVWQHCGQPATRWTRPLVAYERLRWHRVPRQGCFGWRRGCVGGLWLGRDVYLALAERPPAEGTAVVVHEMLHAQIGAMPAWRRRQGFVHRAVFQECEERFRLRRVAAP